MEALKLYSLRLSWNQITLMLFIFCIFFLQCMHVVQHCCNFISLIATSLFTVHFLTAVIRAVITYCYFYSPTTAAAASHWKCLTSNTQGGFYCEALSGNEIYSSPRLALTVKIYDQRLDCSSLKVVSPNRNGNSLGRVKWGDWICGHMAVL